MGSLELSTSKIITSHEKMLSSPKQLLSELHSILESKQDVNTFCELAMQGIMLNSPGYLAESNLQPKYCIDIVSTNTIKGWCFLQAAPNRQLKLKLKHKSTLKVLREYESNILRQDLLEKQIHPTGKCGFDINITPREFELIKTNSIKIVVDNSDFALEIPFQT